MEVVEQQNKVWWLKKSRVQSEQLKSSTWNSGFTQPSANNLKPLRCSMHDPYSAMALR